MSNPAKTPLYDEHAALAAKMVPFAGFAMPVQYAQGALHEYHAVRDGGAGLFDISHMGQVRVAGPEALAFLQYVTSNDVTRLQDGQVQYSALLNENGGFIDDVTTYRLARNEYYLCVNAANRHKDVAHLGKHTGRFAVTVTDESETTALLALQGQAAEEMLAGLTDLDLTAIAYYHFALGSICGQPALVSRTGYTGEDGFELYLHRDAAVTVWRALLRAAAEPAGLAARDMLRIEMGYALYGHEISEEVTPVEANLMWITNLDKGDFLGRAAVMARRAEGAGKQLLGLKLLARGIPRAGYAVVCGKEKVGEVTSGMFSPTLGCGIALAYVAAAAGKRGLAVDIRGRPVAAAATRPPFVPSRVKKQG